MIHREVAKVSSTLRLSGLNALNRKEREGSQRFCTFEL